MYVANLRKGTCALGGVLALGLIFFSGTSISRAALIIDDFGVGVSVAANYFSSEGTSTNWTPVPSRLGQSNTGIILGAQRDVYVGIVAGTAVANSFGCTLGSGKFDVATAEPGSKIVLQYDGLDDEPGSTPQNANNLPAGSRNLRGTGNNYDQFQLTFNYIDPGNTFSTMDYQITVSGMVGGNLVSTTLVPPPIPASSGPASVLVPFSAFPNYASVAPLFSDARSVEIQFNSAGRPNVDFQITAVQTVPEPASLVSLAAGIGVGLLAWGRWRGRRLARS